MAVLRFDVSKLGKAQPLPGGGAVVPARIARTGIQIYRDSQGNEVREYRPPEEVFAEDALASFRAAPVTIGHPRDGRVTPRNWQALSHGTVLDASGREKVDNDEFVGARLALNSADVLTRVDTADLSEVSCGYTCEVVDRAGTTPNGERYDRVQTQIRANHVALLPTGDARAGREARLTLDGNEQHTQGKTMLKIRYDGSEFDPASEADVEALQRRIDTNDKIRNDATEKIAKLEKEKGQLEGKLDAANIEATKAAAAVPDAVKAELAFRSDMRKAGLADDYDFEGKDRVAVKLDAIRLRNPKAAILNEDKPDEARVDGYLESLRERGEDYAKREDKAEDRTDRAAAHQRYLARTKGYDPNAETN